MPGFTPGFKKAFGNLAALAHTTPEKLVAAHKKLAPEERFQDIQQKFSFFQSLPQSNDNINKMTAFLKAVNDVVQSTELAAGLQQINLIQDENGKFAKLKDVFNQQYTLNAFWRCWEQYLRSQSSVMEDIAKRFEEVIEGSRQSMKHVDSQGDYEPTKKIVRDLMRLFYALFDALLISAGYKDVFVEAHDSEDAGYRDPKTNIYRNQRGAYVPE